MSEPEKKSLSDEFIPAAIQDSWDELYNLGQVQTPSPDEDSMRPQPRPERSHNHD